MIRLALGTEPPALAANREAWGEEYATALANGHRPLPERYRRDDVRDALREETHGKCAYCESYIEHVSFAHIEHILPKSIHPFLVCVWENLTLACQRCNTYKGEHNSAEVQLLNPYTENVDEELIFFGPMAIHRSDNARFTISKLKLNRPELLFRREAALREVLRIIELYVRAPGNQAVRAALVEELAERLAEAAEYTNCARCFVQGQAALEKSEVRELVAQVDEVTEIA